MEIKKVVVAGSGVLGYQIAFQVAYSGFAVVVYDINEAVLEKAKAKFKGLCDSYVTDLGATPEELAATGERLSYSSDLQDACEGADLVIEAIPEVLAMKVSFYEQLAKVAPERTIFATNSSTLLPSQLAAATGRPKQFLALHFANQIWKHNTAEIMGHPGTSQEVFDTVVEFAKAIGMLALPLHKEQAGYILNSLLVPLLNAATGLMINQVADPQTIDKTWMKATGAPMGPFAILDMVGITTAYNIVKEAAEKTNNPAQRALVAYYEENFISKNKLGVATGEGFYTYPNPAFLTKDFLK